MLPCGGATSSATTEAGGRATSRMVAAASNSAWPVEATRNRSIARHPALLGHAFEEPHRAIWLDAGSLSWPHGHGRKRCCSVVRRLHCPLRVLATSVSIRYTRFQHLRNLGLPSGDYVHGAGFGGLATDGPLLNGPVVAFRCGLGSTSMQSFRDRCRSCPVVNVGGVADHGVDDRDPDRYCAPVTSGCGHSCR